MLCHTDQSMENIEQNLTHLLMKFEINKSQFSSHTRRLVRQRFLSSHRTMSKAKCFQANHLSGNKSH